MEVRAKKALGQHFLTDQSIARNIVAALSTSAAPAAASLSAPAAAADGAVSGKTAVRDVLEVGPGMGVLTQSLL